MTKVTVDLDGARIKCIDYGEGLAYVQIRRGENEVHLVSDDPDVFLTLATELFTAYHAVRTARPA